MSQATYVAFVPRDRCGKLRHVLESGNTGEITWREKKTLFGSEFYLSGPRTLVRQSHAYIVRWVAGDLS